MPFIRALLSSLLIAMAAIGASRGADADRARSVVAPVLLVCEHGSVKSLIAASLFNQAARERGLPFRAISRGVTPDTAVPPKIAEALGQEGFDVRHFKPARVSRADVATASRVIAIGVDLSALIRNGADLLERWDDVPAATVDYSAARLALKRHVDALLDELQVSVRAATAFTLPSEDRILPSSLELERKTEPWCPGDCAVAVPFVAEYRKGAERLVFVGAHHAFRPDAPTMRAVDEGFAELQPNVVIVEGFPTAMGENPPPLVAEAHRYGAPDAAEFARGEPMYAASIALMRGIPFLGGEPTREERLQVLKTKGVHGH